MQDNDFEKQVHQKMGELKLLPSETVWEQVEMRLQHKEDRRRWLIWLPLLIAGLSLGGYWVWLKLYASSGKYIPVLTGMQKAERTNNDKTSSFSKNMGITKTNDENEIGILKANSEKPILPRSNKKTSNNITDRLQQNKNAGDVHIGTVLQTRSKADIYPVIPYKSVTHKTMDGKILAATGLDISVDQSQLDTGPGIKQPGIKQPQIETATSALKGLIQQDAIKELFPVSIKEHPIVSNPVNTSLLRVNGDASTKIAIKLKKTNSNWQWGLSFQAGRSSLTSGSLTKLFGGGAEKDYTSASISLPGNNNNGASAANKVPNPLKSAAGFSAGIFVKKQLSPQFAVSMGLNYTLFTTTNAIGVKTDSNMVLQNSFAGNQLALDQFYRLGNTDRYTTRYHFMELPVILQTRLIRSHKMPIYWDLGFSLSKLIASNALNFDNVSGVYYQDNQQLNKTQFNILTGLPVSLLSRQRFVLQAGPEFQYGISNVFVHETSPGKHLFFLGLKANILIKK